MPEPTPSGFTVTWAALSNDLAWTNEDTYDYVKVYRKFSTESTWTAYYLAMSPDSTYSDTDVTNTGITYQYYLVGYKSPYEPSNPTDEESVTRPVPAADTLTETVTATDSATGLHNQVNTLTETVTATDSMTALITWASTLTETVTVTDAETDSQSIRTNFAYYIGMYDGTVHTVSASYLSDNGTGITSLWETIETNLGIPTVYKTVYKASLRYVDKSSDTPISVMLSTDGGQTWIGGARAIGDADGKTHTETFGFAESGEYFKFKVESASTNKEFKVIGLDIDFLICGDTVN